MHIGFFDSGLGGKLVADYFKKRYPEYFVMIRNDVKNMPYGNKPEEVLRKVLGVVIPMVEVISNMQEARFLLLATAGTVASQRYVDELKKRDSNKQFKSIPVPQLALLIEQGCIDAAEQLVWHAIDSAGDCEVIVLACTHYCALKEFIRSRYSDKQVLAQDEIVTEKLREYLVNHPEMHNQLRCGITDA